MSHDEQTAAWNYDEPQEAQGYFLVAWRRGDRVVVSELWFNRDAKPKWWSTRGYLGERSSGLRGAILAADVVAWMPLPDPPEVAS